MIGDYPSVTLAKARQARDVAKAQLTDGIDPGVAKQEEKRLRLEAKGQTFEKIGEAFLAKQRKEGQSAATLSKTEYHLKLANRDFGRKPITEITALMILMALRKVEAKGNFETAHRLRAMNNKGDYLFQFLRTWTRPMSENTLNAALRRMGYSGDEMTAHGFRATVVSNKWRSKSLSRKRPCRFLEKVEWCGTGSDRSRRQNQRYAKFKCTSSQSLRSDLMPRQ